MAAICFATIIAITTRGLQLGTYRANIRHSLELFTGYLQIIRPGYQNNPSLQKSFTLQPELLRVLASEPTVTGWTPRLQSDGLVSSGNKSLGTMLLGVDPEREVQVSTLSRHVNRGRWFSARAAREALLGDRLLKNLNVKIGDAIVVLSQGFDGSLGNQKYRVVGVYETSSAQFDRTHVYIALDDARRLLGLQNQIMEFAIRLKDLNQLKAVQQDYSRRLGPTFEVLSFRDLLPLLVAMLDVFREMMGVFYLLVGIAMVFGIINTLLMSVMERIPEFGVLMAMGMQTGQIFAMIVLEAVLLGILGTLLGMGVGLAVCLPFTHSGLDLSMFKESLASFGAGAVIYPALSAGTFVMAALLVPLFSILGAVYPAIRAVRLQPVEALRFT